MIWHELRHTLVGLILVAIITTGIWWFYTSTIAAYERHIASLTAIMAQQDEHLTSILEMIGERGLPFPPLQGR